MILTQGNRSTGEITCTSATIPTKNLIRTGLGSNLGLHGTRLAIDCLSNDTFFEASRPCHRSSVPSSQSTHSVLITKTKGPWMQFKPATYAGTARTAVLWGYRLQTLLSSKRQCQWRRRTLIKSVHLRSDLSRQPIQCLTGNPQLDADHVTAGSGMAPTHTFPDDPPYKKQSL